MLALVPENCIMVAPTTELNMSITKDLFRILTPPVTVWVLVWLLLF